jgi:hypothetical protein
LSLSRFAAAPRKGHLELARKIFGYLRKYPSRDYKINPEPPKVEKKYEVIELKQDFGGQYHYFNEDMDPRFPEPILDELDINVFCDADHGHDKVTGRSITGILGLVGSTPIVWSASRQNCIQISCRESDYATLSHASNGNKSITAHKHMGRQHGSDIERN